MGRRRRPRDTGYSAQYRRIREDSFYMTQLTQDFLSRDFHTTENSRIMLVSALEGGRYHQSSMYVRASVCRYVCVSMYMYVYKYFFPKASAKGSSSNCVAHTTQHNTTQHHTTARHTPARPTTAPHTTARHTPQQDATPPDRLILYSYYILNYFLAWGRIGAT